MTTTAKGPSFFEYFRSYYWVDPKTHAPVASLNNDALLAFMRFENCATCRTHHSKIVGVLPNPNKAGLICYEKLNSITPKTCKTQWDGQGCLLSGRAATIGKIKSLKADKKKDLAQQLSADVRLRCWVEISLDRFRVYTFRNSDTVKVECIISSYPTIIGGGPEELIPSASHVYIRLSRLFEEAKREFGENDPFTIQLEEELAKSQSPQLFYSIIVLSLLSGGLLPLFYAIRTLFQIDKIQKMCHQINTSRSLDQESLKQQGLFIIELTNGVTFDGREAIIEKSGLQSGLLKK